MQALTQRALVIKTLSFYKEAGIWYADLNDVANKRGLIS